MGKLSSGFTTDYHIKKEGNGVYIFVINGTVTIDGHTLNTRDGLGVWDTAQFNLKADSDCEVLLMDVPMGL